MEKTEEEIAAQAEKRRLAGIRLQEQTQKMRMEKLAQKEVDLNYFVELRDYKGHEPEAEYAKRLRTNGFDSEAELQAHITKTQRSLQKARNKDLGIEEDKVRPCPYARCTN